MGSCVHIPAKSDRDLSLSFSNKYTTQPNARAHTHTHTPQLVSVKELKKLRKQVHRKKKNPMGFFKSFPIFSRTIAFRP